MILRETAALPGDQRQVRARQLAALRAELDRLS